MLKRLFDIIVSAVWLVLLSPVLLLTALVVWVSDPGPVLFRAKRVGLHGEPFVMHKFRTMIQDSSQVSAITGSNDPRVFPAGRWLRRLKLDELPQFWDVLRGKMSIVGPRPEDPGIVERDYTDEYRKTLAVRPGLTSPGSIHYYAHAEDLLQHGSAEEHYAESVLPLKIALDQVYVDRPGLLYDLDIIVRTAIVIIRKALGATNFGTMREQRILQQQGHPLA